MSSETHYLNTDLDLKSGEELSAIADFLQSKRWSVHHADWHPDGYWFGAFEHPRGHKNGPEYAILAMLAVLEKLPKPLSALWSRCSSRDFNIGYQSGNEPRCVEQSISSDVMRRIAAMGASISITIYAYDPALDDLDRTHV